MELNTDKALKAMVQQRSTHFDSVSPDQPRHEGFVKLVKLYDGSGKRARIVEINTHFVVELYINNILLRSKVAHFPKPEHNNVPVEARNMGYRHCFAPDGTPKRVDKRDLIVLAAELQSLKRNAPRVITAKHNGGPDITDTADNQHIKFIQRGRYSPLSVSNVTPVPLKPATPVKATSREQYDVILRRQQEQAKATEQRLEELTKRNERLLRQQDALSSMVAALPEIPTLPAKPTYKQLVAYNAAVDAHKAAKKQAAELAARKVLR